MFSISNSMSERKLVNKFIVITTADGDVTSLLNTYIKSSLLPKLCILLMLMCKSLLAF